MIITIIVTWAKYDSHACWACGTDKARAFICPDDSVMLCVGGREGNLFGGEADIPLRQEQLTPRESRDLARLARQMTSNPENAKRELDKSRTSSHVGHTNPITIQVLENGNEVLSWKGDAIGIEGGLLRKIATLMRVG